MSDHAKYREWLDAYGTLHANEPLPVRPRPGDTLVHDGLAEIPRRNPHIPLALVHLGGTRVLGILLTMDADQGVRALQIVKPRHAVPIHYDDYTVFRSSLAEFVRAADRPDLETTIHVLRRDDVFTFDVPSERPSEAAFAAATPS